MKKRSNVLNDAAHIVMPIWILLVLLMVGCGENPNLRSEAKISKGEKAIIMAHLCKKGEIPHEWGEYSSAFRGTITIISSTSSCLCSACRKSHEEEKDTRTAIERGHKGWSLWRRCKRCSAAEYFYSSPDYKAMYDAAILLEKTVAELESKFKCGACEGSGELMTSPITARPCPLCDGTGRMVDATSMRIISSLASITTCGFNGERCLLVLGTS